MAVIVAVEHGENRERIPGELIMGREGSIHYTAKYIILWGEGKNVELLIFKNVYGKNHSPP